MVETQLSSVDLPEPEAPMIETNSPARTSNETSASARVTAPAEPLPRRPPMPRPP